MDWCVCVCALYIQTVCVCKLRRPSLHWWSRTRQTNDSIQTGKNGKSSIAVSLVQTHTHTHTVRAHSMGESEKEKNRKIVCASRLSPWWRGGSERAQRQSEIMTNEYSKRSSSAWVSRRHLTPFRKIDKISNWRRVMHEREAWCSLTSSQTPLNPPTSPSPTRKSQLDRKYAHAEPKILVAITASIQLDH